jgi:aldehyde oxidoreductase
MMESTSFTVNGLPVEVAADHPHLLSALREELGVTSPKDGCSPSGQCGACTVLLDGKAIQSCLVSMEKVEGKSVTTLEGFETQERERLANAFAATGALQCGFCTPGILVRTKALIDQKGSDLDRSTTAGRLGGHLCRCTGYTKIFEAIDLLVNDDVIPPRSAERVGDDGAKYEGTELALGTRGYVDDIRPEGLLHGALRLTDHARADVLRIDTSAAEAVEGVIAVFTGADVPGQLHVGIIYEDWPVFIPEGGRTSYYGDVIAIVVAESKAIARAAADLVEVEYNVLEPFADPHAALASDEDAVWGLDGNVLSRSVYRRGDVDATLAASAHTVHEVFHTQRVEHAFLEPESTLAVPTDDGGLHVYSGGQGVWDDRNQIAALLAVDPSTIVVELVSNGGAFGGKEDMSNQGQTALAAFLLRRPVSCTLTREQSFRIHAKRHPI